MTTYTFTLSLDVHDKQGLLDAARSHPDAAHVPTENFYCDDGEIDVEACLVMLLDPSTLPGCSINYSEAEISYEP